MIDMSQKKKVDDRGSVKNIHLARALFKKKKQYEVDDLDEQEIRYAFVKGDDENS